MTSEAPERMVVAKCHPFKEPDDFYVCHPRLKHPAGVEYIRADLHQQALEAAEQRGYARGIEAVVEVVNDACPDYEGGCSLQDQAARDLRDQIAMDICALSPTPPVQDTIRCAECTCEAGGADCNWIKPPPAPVTVQEAGFDALILAAKAEAEKAMRKFPQPNYVISKVAEEAGEVVRAAIHCAEGREDPAEVRAEMVQLLAMLYRLWVEGDQVHGLRALAEQEKTDDN